MLYDWTIEHPELHKGIGAMDGKYFKINGRYYYAQSYQFMQGSPDADLGAVVFDVTGLPDTSTVKVVARIRYPQAPGGFHNTFAYKHSDGRVLYFATVSDSKALIYDLDKVVSDTNSSTWLIGSRSQSDPAQADHGRRVSRLLRRLRSRPHTRTSSTGRGWAAISVWDVTHPDDAEAALHDHVFGMDLAHTFTPSPDGRYAVTETEYQYTPLRIWDLTDAQAGKVKNVDIPIAAWTADWQDLSHNHEVRWPYVFVSAYEDGLQIFSLKDPKHPQDRRALLHVRVRARTRYRADNPDNGCESTIHVNQGAFGVDVRNRDGLIVISDARTWPLALSHGRLQGLERPGVRHAEHLERAGLRPRPDRRADLDGTKRRQ